MGMKSTHTNKSTKLLACESIDFGLCSDLNGRSACRPILEPTKITSIAVVAIGQEFDVDVCVRRLGFF